MNPSSLSRRLRDIESRLRTLETQDGAAGENVRASAAHRRREARPDDARADDVFWVIDGLQRRLGPRDGAVVYAGRFVDADGADLRWQIGRPQEALLAEDWDDLAPRLAALGHPVRLRLLRALLQGTRAVADLAAQPGMGTTGQLYHHLRELESAGWLHSPQRGSYAVRPERTIPLMVALAAARQ